MPAASTPTPIRRRWWVRVLLWLVSFVVLLLLAIGGAAWWLWTHPEKAFQMAVEHIELPFKPEITAIKVERDSLRLDGLTLRDQDSDEVWVKTRSVQWTGHLPNLSLGRLGHIVVDGLDADLDSSLSGKLHHWLHAPAEPGSASPALQVDQLDLTDAHLRIAATETWPALECRIDQHARGIDLSDPTHPVIEHFQVALHNAEADGHQVPQAEAAGSLTGDGELILDRLTLSRGHAAPSPWLLRRLAAPSTLTVTTAPPIIRRVNLKRLELNDFAMENGDPSLTVPDWWPRLSGRMTLIASDLLYDDSRGLTLGLVKITANDLAWQPTSASKLLTLRAAEVEVGGWRDDGTLHIVRAEFHQPAIEWTQALEDSLQPSATVNTAPPRPALSVQLDRLIIDQAQLSLQRTKRVEFTGKTQVSVELDALRFDGRQLTSSKPQRLTLSDLSLASHPASREQALDPILTLDRAMLAIVPDDWQQHSTIAELTLTHPVITAREENLPMLKATASTSSSAPLPMISVRQLAVIDGSLDIAVTQGQRMELKTNVSIATEADTHRLRLAHIKAQLPQHAKLPVAGIDEIEGAFRWNDLWNHQRVQSLRIKGGELDVGDALLSLSAGSANATAPAATPSPSPLAGWRVNDLTIEDTSVTLQRIAPGLPPVKFTLDYHASDLPLEPAALAGNFKPQRIELSQLSIKSPYDPLHNVAHLGSVFIDFTLDSLFKQRIDIVHIIAPTLFVGEDLFWYIDYYRKYAAGLPLPGTNENRMALASTDGTIALAAAASAATAPIKDSGAWSVDTLKVDGGKLVIAPKGQPLPGIPRPFPFSFTTHLNQGKLEAEFDIPSDTYTWEQLKLQLEGMRGRVQFNLPIKTVDNNLTETFRVDRIRWKDLHLEDAHLSVTYDANGIYAQFGGAAYDGYVNGAFNVYLDTAFSWDGWISGTNVRTTEITRQLCPAYFLLDGQVATTVVAQGNMNEVYQCDVKFSNASPGKFSIVALNNMLSDLPKDVATFEDDLMRIGVETLRDFAYDKVDAKARFYGREGKGYLRLSSPTGTRNFDVNIFDHRWTDKKPAAQANAR